jgi:hypothetical protein
MRTRLVQVSTNEESTALSFQSDPKIADARIYIPGNNHSQLDPQTIDSILPNVSPQGKRQFSFEQVLAAAHALIEQSALPLVGYTYEENIGYDATRDLDHRGGYHRSRRGTR